jgi:hypothetical protein
MISALVKRYWLQLLVLALIGALAFFVNHYRDNAITYKDQRDKATKNLRLANATIKDMQIRQRDVAALDAKYTKNWLMRKKPLSVCIAMSLLAVSGCSSTQNVPRTERPAPAAGRCFRPPTY